MSLTPLFLVLTLLGAPRAAAQAQPPPTPFEDAADRFLRRTADVFTSNSAAFGQVHLPVVYYNPNAGPTYGVLPVWLVHDPQGNIRHLFAPMFTYNSVFGAAFAGNYYFYPSRDAKLRLLAEKSEKSNYRFAFRYDDRQFLDGRATVLLDTNYEADGSVQFFGVGPGSSQGDEESVRLLEEHAHGELGLRFLDVYSVAGGWEGRHTNVEQGPFSAPRPVDPGLRTGTAYSMPVVRLTRDTRDLAFAPTSGSLSEAYAAYSARALGSSSSFETYGGDWRLYVPASTRLVTALHARGEWSGGGEVPFTALSMLGGARSLRGFADGRFQDRGLAFANLEERFLLHSIEILNNPTEFQIAPFVEAGEVFPTPERARVHDVETVVGVAFRAVVKPSVVGRVDVGVGREGAAVFVGIDYPF